MSEVSFFVPGEPKGQPRPRAFAFNGRARVYDPGTAEGWKSQVALEWRRAQGDWPTGYGGPVDLSIMFHMPRPKSHFNKHGLKPDSPVACCKKPDVDNLSKAVMDALTQLGAWHDDSQVASLFARKVFADGRAGASILLRMM